MAKIHVTKDGKFYKLNSAVVKPKDFWGVDGFKFVNHVYSWVKGGHGGESAEVHLDRARRYIEHEVVGLGCRRMRAPVELMFWSEPYFDLAPSNPAPYDKKNCANEIELVDLNCGTGSAFRLTSRMKSVIRAYVRLAREFDIVIEVPWLWTIKGKADKDTALYPDPRESVGVSVWNEHFMAAHGIGAYLHKLYEEGADDLEPGGLNLISDLCNEYTAHADIFSNTQLRQIARRWRERDAVSQPILLVSQSGVLDTYDPPLQSEEGTYGYSAPCIHPPRDRAKDKNGKWHDWWDAGPAIRAGWPGELIDVNESMLGMTQAQRHFWVPMVPKWAGLGTTDMAKWRRMHESFVANDIYSTFHTFRGMDAYWPETEQTVVEETIREIAGGSGPPPPPPPPPPPEEVDYRPIINRAYKEILGREGEKAGLDHKNEKMGKGMTEAEMREEMIRSPEYTKKHPERQEFTRPVFRAGDLNNYED